MSGTPVVVFDLDQTVIVGEGPVRAYAHEVGSGLRQSQRVRLTERLDHYLGLRSAGADPGPDEPQDAYGLVWQVATRWLPEREVSAALARSRERMATAGANVLPAPGAQPLLAALEGSVHRVLMTKSPGDGLLAVLANLGLVELFDLVAAGMAKPRVWPEVIAALVAGTTGQLCSVGDHWINDIEQPRALGCFTVWIRRHSAPGWNADVVAPDLAAAREDLVEWGRLVSTRGDVQVTR